MELLVVLKSGEDGYVLAECPALPGCISEGDTRDEALTNIREAIDLYLELVDDDVAVPADAEVIEIAV